MPKRYDMISCELPNKRKLEVSMISFQSGVTTGLDSRLVNVDTNRMTSRNRPQHLQESPTSASKIKHLKRPLPSLNL